MPEVFTEESARVRVQRIADEFELRIPYPSAVMDEVAAVARAPGIDDRGLQDLTDLPFITIDYEQSRDLDQAMYIRRAPDGGFALFYALADAAWFVPPGSALFDEALSRGASYYLPGLTVPMLPPELSEGLVSLNEDVERRAAVFEIELDAEGAVRRTELVRARIRSRRKLTYEGVQRHVAEGTLAGHDFTETLDLLGEVGVLRVALASARDVVRYDRVAVRVGVSDDGQHLTIHGEPRNAVQRWNEQVSLLCNIQGARLLAGRGIFRVHPAPPPEKLDQLHDFIEALVTDLELDPAVWRWRRSDGDSLADYIDLLPDERLAIALQRQAMLVNELSTFETEPGPHYGIGAPAYARFSSPMREVVGIITEHTVFDTPLSAGLIDRGADIGNTAKDLQKRITKRANRLAIDELFHHDLERPRGDRPVRTGTVMGMTEHKLYVRLDDPPIDVKLYGDYDLRNPFEAKRGTQVIRVGDPLDVVTRDYDTKRHRWLLSPV